VGNYGWAYVAGGGGLPGGVSGSVQLLKDSNTQTGSAAFIFREDTVTITGSVYVSGTLTANQYNVNVINETVTNISASGDTKFGNSQDDLHQFSGSLFVSGNNDGLDIHQITGSLLLSSSAHPLRLQGLFAGDGATAAHYLAATSTGQIILTSSIGGGGGGIIDEYTNPGDNRIITSIDSSGINAEQNLTFNGTNLNVVGSLTSSVSISSSIGQFHNLTGSYITGSGIKTTTLTARNIGGTLTTPAQLNITSVGTLTSLTCSGDLQVDTNTFNVNSSTNKIGIGRIHAQKKLEVLDNNEQLRLSYSKYIFGVSNNVFSDVYTTNSGHLVLTASSERVGIGTSSPTRMLDVDGHMRVSGNLEISGTLSAKVTEFVVSADNITFGDSATDTLTFNAATASIPNDLVFGTNALSVLNSGKVGIGVRYPDHELEVLSTSGQLKLSYDGTKNSTLAVDSSGFLTVTPSGNWLTASCNLFVSGNTILGTDASDTVTVSGALTSSVGFSGSHGLFTQLTASHVKVISLTDGTATMQGGAINASTLGGQLTTAAQPNVTSVGTLTSLTVSGDVTVDTNVLKVNSTSNRVGIGVTDPVRKLEVLDTAAQLRLTYQRAAGFNPLITSDIKTTSAGHLILSGSGGRVGIGTDTPSRMLDVNGHMRVSGNLEVSGSLHARVSEFIVSANNITFGDSATDTLTFNASTASVANGLNWDANTLVINSSQNRIGIGVEHPTTKLQILSTTPQLKLSYDTSKDTTLTVSSTGDLNIDPTGNWVTASSGLNVSGSVFLGTDLEHDTVVSGELTASVAISSSLGMFTGLTSSVITDGTATMRGGNITGVGTLTATYLGGELTTAAQPNVTSVGTLTSLSVLGDLTVDTQTLKVDSTNNRVAIGRTDPQRPLETLSTDPQLRLSYSKYIFGVSNNVFSDVYTTSTGFLVLTASSERVGIGTAKPTSTLSLSGTLHISASSNPVKLLGLQTGSLAGPGSYLGLNTAGQIVLTSSSGTSGGGGGSSAVNGPVSTNGILIEGYNYFTTISAPTIVSLPSASIGKVVHVKAGPGVSAVNYIRISGSQSGDTIDGINHIDLESPYGALAFVYVASNKDWRIL